MPEVGGLPCPDSSLQASRGEEGGESQDGGSALLHYKDYLDG